MTCFREIIHKPRVVRSHKTGRYILDGQGVLRGKDGDRVDLHAFLTDHSPSVEVISIDTKVMRTSGLFPGSFALIDRSIRPKRNSVIAVRYNGQVVIRRLVKKYNQWLLEPDDPREKTLPINKECTVENLGVVTFSIIKL